MAFLALAQPPTYRKQTEEFLNPPDYWQLNPSVIDINDRLHS